MPEQKPTIGRMVHYKLKDGQVRPAVIVRVWGQCGDSCGSCGDCVNLVVFADGWNDSELLPGAEGSCSVSVTSVTRGDEPGQWNWPNHL